MVVRTRRAIRAREQQDRVIHRVAGDIRLTRKGAGLSQAAAAHSVGLGRSTFGRIERAELPNVTLAQLCAACEAVGLEFAGRAHPNGDPARDSGQLGVLERLHIRLPPGAPWSTEVPFPIPQDRRAWDAMTTLERVRIGIEAEMRLDDVQALERKLRLKLRDGGVDVLILLVADTRGNRALLAAHRTALRATFPLDSRAVLAALAAGRAPTANGIVVL
jgi:transcriptional regulator with XRE-family HTH domain